MLTEPFELPDWARAYEILAGSANMRATNAHFRVTEELGFEPDGEGEHALILIEKSGLNSADIVNRLSLLSGVKERDIGYCGLKDRHAVTRQWFSVGLAGKAEPDWAELASAQINVIRASRHRRKLRRGVHKANRFVLRLTNLNVDREAIERRLELIAARGFPNYFGGQRFGLEGSNLKGALAWMNGASRAPRRQRRGFYLSALRAYLFNEALSRRIAENTWEQPSIGDRCILDGRSSHFMHDGSDADIAARANAGDLHLALPLWGLPAPELPSYLNEHQAICSFLESQGLDLDQRSARVRVDDISWQFCDDDELQLEFSLPRGCFATSLLRELIDCRDVSLDKDKNIEQ